MMMSKSRIELHQLLLKLEKCVPAMIEKYPEDKEFMSAFMRDADRIVNDASSEDQSWVRGQIDCILDESERLRDGHSKLLSKRPS